jgi:hypothetical protein
MKVLHIKRTEADETVEQLMLAFSDDEVETVPLYEDDVDWAALIDKIFASDKVISWW